MKNYPLLSALTKFALAPCIAVAALAATVSAQQLTYNFDLNSGWFAADAWGEDPPTFDSSWIDGRVAAFTAKDGGTIQFNGNATVANFNLAGVTGVLELTSAGGPYELSFSDTLDFAATWGVRASGNVSIQGDFTMTNGWLRPNWQHANAAYSGTATLNGGKLTFNNAAQGGINSNFVIGGGTLDIFQNDYSIGTVSMSAGQIEIGRTGSATASAGLTVSELSGSGGTIRRSQNSSVTTNVFTVDQATDTAFGGNFEATNDQARLQFVKAGSGSLSLSGEINLITVTQVNGGGLFINGTMTSFSSSSGTTAIAVNDGILGGTGTINTASGHDVVLGADGGLAGGGLNAAGLTTFALGAGELNLAAATASANTGWLRFDLGAADTAGVSYDQILLSSGVLNIGTGLDFNSFDFNLLAGFGPGTYTLFDTGEAILGSLGTATGTLGGYDAELFIVGNDLVLQVIPEPASMAAIFAALVGSVVLLRRRRG